MWLYPWPDEPCAIAACARGRACENAFAIAEKLDPRTINQQVQGAVSPAIGDPDGQRPLPAAQGGVIRHGLVRPRKLQKRPHHAYRRAQGSLNRTLLDRDFTADRPKRKWAGNISYIWTREGWLYLAVVRDLHSRRVIGWAVSNRMKRHLAIRALKMAITLRSPPKGCIFHNDRGSQYCSHDYRKILREHGF